MGEERVFVATLSKLNRINHGNKSEIIGYKSVGLLAGLYSVVQKEQRIMHDKIIRRIILGTIIPNASAYGS